MATNIMHGDTRRDLIVAVMEANAPREYPAQHDNHVIDVESGPQHALAHMAPGGEIHLPVLNMECGISEEIVIARMIVVHMADDDVLDIRGFDPDRSQTLAGALQKFSVPPLRRRRIESCIDHYALARTNDSPDIICHRHRTVMGIAAEKIFARMANMFAIADGIYFVLWKILMGHFCSATSAYSIVRPPSTTSVAPVI
jgi:hypothetical protein